MVYGMNKREKEVLQAQLNNEKAVLKKLEEMYKESLLEINSKIEMLMARQDADLQHVIYQVEYQKALKTQVQSILETLQANEFETISEYLAQSYEDGFLGTMYNLQGQGIPLIFPIDQEQVVEAIQTETKLTTRTDTATGKLYASLGDSMKDLQKKISGEISRGIAGGQMYTEIARNIEAYARIPRNNAMRIVRTEAGRIQSKASLDACHKAKEKGADIVKQWDATLDKRTRKSHRELDGQVRELDEKFEIGNYKADAPRMFGVAKEDINCRCAFLQRARWAVDNDFTKWGEDAPIEISDDGTTQFHKIEAKNYDDFKNKYKKASERVRDNAQKMNGKDTLEELEKQFSDMTEGYSYDDFIKDFGSIEDGFEGASVEEIRKAKRISEKIQSLKSGLNNKKQALKNAIRTKQESVQAFKTIGIDLKDNSAGGVSDKTLSKFVDFVTNFENNHSGYFDMNKLKLKSITIVDSLKIRGKTVAGGYYSDSQSIRLMKKAIETKPTSKLLTYSKSDDHEIHFLAHEYGHYVADSLAKNLSITDYDIIQNSLLRYFEGDIFSTKTSNLVDVLGSYGSKNAHEAFAEAFAEAYTCKEPRKFAKIFKEELEKALKNK